MNLRTLAPLAVALLLGVPVATNAALAPYAQSFEGLTQADPAALSADGWVVYGNVYTPAHVYMYGYGPFPAPNPGGGFCAIDAGQGGVDQGLQQLSVYSDYNNADHANGNIIESNVYREMTVGAADANTTWRFSFDAKMGNLVAPSTAAGFIKTLNPAAGWALTNYLTADMTAIPANWFRYEVSIPITPALVGQVLQIGFVNTATNYISSGIFYDNVVFEKTGTTDAPAPRAAGLDLAVAGPNPFAAATNLAFTLPQHGAADVSVYDVTGRRVATLFHGDAAAGTTVATWNGRFADGSAAPAGVYECVLQTASARRARSIVLAR